VSPRPAVDEHIDDEAALLDRFHHCGRSSRRAQIGGNDGNFDTRRLEFRGKRFHRFTAARDEHQIVPVVCSFARESSADAGRRARHQRNGTSGTSHVDASFLPVSCAVAEHRLSHGRGSARSGELINIGGGIVAGFVPDSLPHRAAAPETCALLLQDRK
jgi:hypothetical protein